MLVTKIKSGQLTQLIALTCFLVFLSDLSAAETSGPQGYKCYAQASDGEYYIVGTYASSDTEAKKKLTGKMVKNKKSGKAFSIQYIPECTVSTRSFVNKNAQTLDQSSEY